jgi:mono/diheme cytochrome c family protein
MRRIALVLMLAALVFAAGIAAAGCGGEDEASPTPDTFTDTTDTTETDTTETTTETTPPGDAAAGKEIFLQECGTCHVLADAGTTGTVGPNLDESQPEFDLAVDRVTNGQGVMPPFQDTLSEQQIIDVATYVSTAAGG